VSADIFASQPADEDRLAELYDLEHDDLIEDLDFYRELARRTAGPVLDLGCGSGRLFGTLLDGGAPRRASPPTSDSPPLLRMAGCL
jgi:SAM-dependent methyltransferase